MVEIDTDPAMANPALLHREAQAFLQPVGWSDRGRTLLNMRRFIKRLDAAFSHFETPPEFLVRSVEQEVMALRPRHYQRLMWFLVRETKSEERTGKMAAPHQWEVRKRVASILLRRELQSIAHQVKSGASIGDGQARQIDALTALMDVEDLEIDLVGKNEGINEGTNKISIRVDPVITLDASWVDVEARRLVLGTVRTDGLFAVAASVLLRPLV
ncbi:MAG: hypothetical protein ACPG5T_06720, partial [Endozoicomonas sp.]